MLGEHLIILIETMARTPEQIAATKAVVEKRRAENTAKNALPTTQVVQWWPQQTAEAVQAAQAKQANAPVGWTPPAVPTPWATPANPTPPANPTQAPNQSVALPKIGATANINPTTGAMTNADGTPYVPGPNSTMNPKTEDQSMLFGDAAVAKNLEDPKFIQNRDASIIKELSAKWQYGDMNDAELKKNIEADLVRRGADIKDPRISQTIDRVASGIRWVQPMRTADDYYNILAQGWTLPNQDISNPNAQYAMSTFKKVQNIATKTPQQISSDLASGNLLIWGNLYNKLVAAWYWPKLEEAKKYKNLQFRQDVNNYLTSGTDVDPDKPLGEQKTSFPDHPNFEESLSQEFSTKSPNYVDMFRESIANNQELNDAKTAARSTLDAINEKRRLISNLSADIKAQIIALGGTISDWYLALLAQNKSKPIVRELEGLQDQYNSEMALVSDLKDTAKTEFELKMKQYGEDREVALENMKFERDYKKQLNIMGIQDQYAQQAEERAFGRDLKKMDIQDQYSQAAEERQFGRQIKLGDIQYDRDLNKIQIGFEQDIKKLQMSQNFDLNKMDKQAYINQQQAKYEYDLKNQATMNSNLGMVDVSQIEQAREKYGYAPWWDNPQIAKLCLPDGSNAGQCAKYVNDLYAAAWAGRPFGWADQTIKGKIAVTQSDKRGSTKPVIGWSVVSDFGLQDPDTKQNYGHVEQIIAIKPDGTLVVSGSNFTNDKNSPKYNKAYTREILPWDPTVKWYTKAPWAETWIQHAQLTDKNFTQFNQATQNFRNNPVVQSYEKAITSSRNLLSSLNDASGPGDVAGIFDFMKTLDPTSTVREGEFALAAKSAWLKWDIQNLYNRVVNGQRLTADQRREFWQLAKTYIRNQGKSYDRVYDDMVRAYEAGWIDKYYLPTSASKELDDIWGDTDLKDPYEE